VSVSAAVYHHREPRPRLWAVLALLAALSMLLLDAPPPAAGADEPTEIVRKIGRVTIRVDTSQAFPGGVLVVRLQSRSRLGTAFALLDGRRAPFSLHRGVPRALVPVPLLATPGPATLGIEIGTRFGRRQRIPLDLAIAERSYPTRIVALSDEQRALLALPTVTRDGRQFLALVRTESKSELGSLYPPLTGSAGTGFGEIRNHPGAPAVEGLLDAIAGEHHRGLDYTIPPGAAVRSPAAATVLFAGPLALTGETLILDHGQGVVSALLHLARLDVRGGDQVPARAVVGLSGQSGIAPEPMLQWRVYLHGVAVDPAVMQQVLG